MGVRSRKIAGRIVLDSVGFLGAPVDFLQQALLAAKSDAQKAENKGWAIGASDSYILNTTRGVF
jgi:hypothetical protein